MADWRGRGSPPAPEDRTIIQFSGDAYVPPAGYEDFGPEEGSDQWTSYDDEPDEYLVASGGGYRAPTLADRYREGPPWFRFGAPALLLLIVLVAVAAVAGGGGADDDGDGSDVATDGERSLDDVIEIAYEAGFPDEVSEARVGSLITFACEQVGERDGAETVAEQIDRFDFDGRDQSGATDGLRAGGEAFCGSKVDAEDPEFFRDVALLVSGDTTRASTTTSTTRVVSTTSTTTKSTTSTTKKPSTTTTKKPTTTTAPSSTTTTSTTVDTSSTTSSSSIPDFPEEESDP